MEAAPQAALGFQCVWFEAAGRSGQWRRARAAALPWTALRRETEEAVTGSGQKRVRRHGAYVAASGSGRKKEARWRRTVPSSPELVAAIRERVPERWGRREVIHGSDSPKRRRTRIAAAPRARKKGKGGGDEIQFKAVGVYMEVGNPFRRRMEREAPRRRGKATSGSGGNKRRAVRRRARAASMRVRRLPSYHLSGGGEEAMKGTKKHYRRAGVCERRWRGASSRASGEEEGEGWRSRVGSSSRPASPL